MSETKTESIQEIIDRLDIGDYYFSVDVDNEYNTTGEVELHALNSESYVAVGYHNCKRELDLYIANCVGPQ